MTFAERLKELRTEKQMTLNDIAEYIGVQRATIYKYEHGMITNIPPDKVHMMAELFGVTRPYLMGWTDDKNVNPFENLDMVAEKLKIQSEDANGANIGYWKSHNMKGTDCITAATQALRALIKYNVSRTPIYPQQVLQNSKQSTMITFDDTKELQHIIMHSDLSAFVESNDYVMSSIYTDSNNQHRYMFAVNRNAPIGKLRLALAVCVGHIYMGHTSYSNDFIRRNKEAECFAVHFEFPRPLIKLLQERGVRLTMDTFSRIFGECEWCINSMLKADPVRVSPELNRLVKEQFVPYVDALEEVGFLSMPDRKDEKVLDLSRYMGGYKE